DEAERIVDVEGDAATVDAVDPGMDEVAAGCQWVLKFGADPEALPGRDRPRAVGVFDRRTELEYADPVGVGEDEANVEAGDVALGLHLHPQADLVAVLEA